MLIARFRHMRMNIKALVATGFGSVGITMVALATVLGLASLSVHLEFARARAALEQLDAIDHIALGETHFIKGVGDVLLVGDRGIETMRKGSAEAHHAIAQLAVLTSNEALLVGPSADQEAEFARVTTIEHSIEEIDALSDRILEERAIGDAEAARHLLTDEMEVLFDHTFRDTIAVAQADEQQEVDAAQNRTQIVITRMHLGTWALPALALVLILGSLRIVFKHLSARTSELLVGAEYVAAGNLDMSIEEGPPDVLGNVARAFNTMRRDLKTTMVSKEVLTRSNEELQASVARLRDARERLELSERMATVGTMAAGVAHEINNPLAFVIGNLGYLRERCKNLDPEAAAALEDVAIGSERIRTIVRDLKAFARSDARPVGSACEPTDVPKAVAVAVTMANGEIRQRATFRQDHEAGLPPVLVSEGRLVQVLLNLLMNAAHAIPPGAPTKNRIEIATRRQGNRVVIEVEDSGSGMSAETREKIFDPFFTTKPVGVGTGLGLSICLGIVTEAGGTFEVESQLDVGTTFRILLPAAQTANG